MAVESNFPWRVVFTSGGFGMLYNRYAAVDSRNIANTGWHVPTKTELDTLVTYCGGADVAGGKLKATTYSNWKSPNTGATNEFGFNARGGNVRGNDGVFYTGTVPGWYARFWTTTDYDETSTYNLQLFHNAENALMTYNPTNFRWGYSIRLIKDTTTLSHGETGTYTGNDGKTYASICIGTQEILSSNLRETKYRNSDDIPEVTGNSAWAALTTGAFCLYDNNWDNL